VIGDVKCFLAKDSPQREVVDQLNISSGYYCRMVTLPNELEGETHAAHRHPSRWKAYQNYIEKQRLKAIEDRQEAQTTAILELARRGQATESASSLRCSVCEREVSTAAGLAAHMKTHEAA
jgi:hypothetical protein